MSAINSSVQPKPFFVYGTSGFRAKASLLTPVIRRAAFFAACRAKKLGGTVGLMITASHNPVDDNGIKLIDPNGGMLSMADEREVTAIVNMDDARFEKHKTCLYLEDLALRKFTKKWKPMVVVGTDTRPSSPSLLAEAEKELLLAEVAVAKLELHTTPQLHFFVRAINLHGINSPHLDFVSHFRNALTESFKLIPMSDCKRYTNELFVDCANGVGALWVDKYLAPVEFETAESDAQKKVRIDIEPVQLTLLNADTKSELLNQQCGADFVKIHSKVPTGFGFVPQGARCASLDGDADRIVYFWPNSDKGDAVLIDGDHIAALFARFIVEQFSSVANAKEGQRKVPLTVGVVQTAYANGNSTRYFAEKLGIKTVLTKTGVKYLEEAARTFDVGIYFEANGHGTACFSDKFKAYIDEETEKSKSDGQLPRNIALLSLFSKLVNEVVGDGIADLLAVECILRYFDWSIQDWLDGTYADIPSVQKKVKVADKSIYETDKDCETVLVRPEGLQAKIDSIMAGSDKARAFIRPSGTEPILRIYAEANSLEEADRLAEQLTSLIS